MVYNIWLIYCYLWAVSLCLGYEVCGGSRGLNIVLYCGYCNTNLHLFSIPFFCIYPILFVHVKSTLSYLIYLYIFDLIYVTERCRIVAHFLFEKFCWPWKICLSRSKSCCCVPWCLRDKNRSEDAVLVYIQE